MKALPSGPVIMGIVNVTPDSFSDGGRYLNSEKAAEHALRLIGEGAGIIDIGGESTRPGATPVSADEEIDRVLPVIEKLKNCGALVSIDTRHAKTMRAALAAGAGMINDITALRGDPDSVKVASESDAWVCLMHMQGDSPQTMQKNPSYNNVVNEVSEFLHQRIILCQEKGIAANRLIIDPGIGFGKNFEHNILLLRNVSKLCNSSFPVMIGVSRKSFLEKISSSAEPDQRLSGSIAAALWCLTQGVRIFRVHDVGQTRQAFETFQVLRASA